MWEQMLWRENLVRELRRSKSIGRIRGEMRCFSVLTTLSATSADC